MNTSSRLVLFGLTLMGFTACRSFDPAPLTSVPFQERTLTQTEDDVRVSVVALNQAESKRIFGVDVWSRDVQPVWIEVENSRDTPFWFVPSQTDPDYFSPAEVAYMKRFRWSGKKNDRMRAHFESLEFPMLVPPNATVSGFLHTGSDPGLKFVNVSLLSFREIRDFRFTAPVPGLKADFQDVDLDSTYPAHELIDCDETELRRQLSLLPATASNKRGHRSADPLNLVIIGDEEAVLSALVAAGWDVTESMSPSAIWRTIRSSLFGREYRHSPVSSLYVFGRRQEAAFQKARASVDERNHLRLWLTPLRYQGERVWLGQISRDIGVKFTLKTGFLTTHVIDPDVDNDRVYLLQTLVNANAVRRFGYVRGVEPAAPDAPRYNLGGDPYYTDGLRAVIQCSKEPVDIADVELLNWAWPPGTQPYLDDWLKSWKRPSEESNSTGAP